MSRFLKKRGNTCKILDFSLTCLGIKSLHVTAFTLFKRGTDINFQKIVLSDNISRHFTNIVIRTDKSRDCYNTRIKKEFGNFGYTPDILHTVGLRKTEVIVDATADVVTIQDTAKQSSFMKFALQGNGYRTFAGAAQTGKPNHHAVLLQQVFFVFPHQHFVKYRIYVVVFFHMLLFLLFLKWPN